MNDEEQSAMPEEELSPAEAAVLDLQRQLEEEQAKADEYLDQWRRSMAEFSNYRKRVTREREELQRTAAGDFIKRLLSVVDDLELAFEHLPAELENHEWVIGVRMVYQKLMDLLISEGLEEIDAGRGTAFDPAVHEAISYEESQDQEEGEIIAPFRKGYRMGDRVLRPAQVRVAKKVHHNTNNSHPAK